MPTISEFFGIVIRMSYDDHNPLHFHAYYGEYEALVSIGTLEILNGSLPKRVLSLVVERALDHRKALREDWELAELHETLKRFHLWSDKYA